jgi:hypothetical protein
MRSVLLCYFLLKKMLKILRGCLDEEKIKFNEMSDSIYSKIILFILIKTNTF